MNIVFNDNMRLASILKLLGANYNFVDWTDAHQHRELNNIMIDLGFPNMQSCMGAVIPHKMIPHTRWCFIVVHRNYIWIRDSQRGTWDWHSVIRNHVQKSDNLYQAVKLDVDFYL